MALITLNQICLAFGHVPLLDHQDFSLEANERVGLVGRNGTGKSSLLKMLAGLEKPDDGLIQQQNGLRLAYVPQEPEMDGDATVFDVTSGGLARAKALREQYLSHEPGVDLDALQNEIEALDAWNWEQRVEQTLDKLELDASARIGELSGGLKKRVALARALVAQPDVLLLDEPTNHLDLATREALSMALNEFEGTVMLVSHDRALLRAVCDEFWMVGRGKVEPFDGDLDDYQRYLLEESKRLREEAKGMAKDAASQTAPASVVVPQPKATPSVSAAPASSLSAGEQRKQDAQRRQQLAAQTRPLKKELEQNEQRMTAIAQEKNTLEARLSQALPPAEIAQAGRQLKALSDEMSVLEERWMELSEQLQTLQAEA